MANLKMYAVLTGDIVASQQLSSDELNRVRTVVKESCELVSHWSDDLVPYSVELSRGDAWQLLLTDPAIALRASLFIRSALLARCGVDTRLSVAIDEVTVLAETLALSDGPAFVRSGRALDGLARTRLLVNISAKQTEAPWVRLVSTLCDTLVGTWTQRQAELIHAYLPPNSPSQSAIAARLNPPVSKQAVGKGLRAAHWDAVAHALEVFEATDWAVVRSASEDSL